jgi:hypothetical protein
VIPETLGTIVAFLGFVAPGLAFELLREKRRPSIEETAFREASRIALTSLVFTAASVLLLAAVRHFRSSVVVDPARWILYGSRYVHGNLELVATTLLLELAIALILAVLLDWLLRQSAPGRIVPGSIWFQLFRQGCPEGATPWLHLKLKDETEVWGFVGDYTPDQKLENRELTIFGPKLQYLRKGEAQKKSLHSWSSFAVRGDEISWMKVAYVAKNSRGDQVILLPREQPRPRGLSRFTALSGQHSDWRGAVMGPPDPLG